MAGRVGHGTGAAASVSSQALSFLRGSFLTQFLVCLLSSEPLFPCLSCISLGNMYLTACICFVPYQERLFFFLFFVFWLFGRPGMCKGGVDRG